MTAKKVLNVTEDLALFFNADNGQHTLRALKSFPVDSALHFFSAREYVETPTYLSVQVDKDKHIHLFPEFLQYINHSCEPNVFFDTDKNEVVSLKEINENDEITFFYPSTEWDMTRPFQCFCNTSSCLGVIQGAAHLHESTIAKYCFAGHIYKKLTHKHSIAA